MKVVRGLATIVGGLVLGGLVGVFIHKAVSEHTAVAKNVPVVVAAVDIAPGNVLRATDLHVVQWPHEVLPPQSAYALRQVEKRLVSVPITRGEPILLPKLLPARIQICLEPPLTKRVVPISGHTGE